ncbi:MAG: hypothetical protein A2Z25_07240 [Planctomycetes bacterium RBG_16_55_9]|nr:MAG: hypothetical protein A2Z25_07240 [Planctomycetes bacterium RBG_16_55_9]
MSKKKVPKARCSRAGHNKHICALADQYFHINCADEYRVMIKEPQFKCQFCGRTAKSDKSLCYPADL